MHHRELQYYQRNPSPENCTGDIWTNIPFHNLCKREAGTGVIISPACDLANCKTEVVTVLPIIGLADYFSCAASFMEYRSLLNSLLKTIGLDRFSDYVGIESIPLPEDITALLEQVERRQISDTLAKNRAVAALTCLRRCLAKEDCLNSWSELKTAFGKKFGEDIAATVTNSRRADLHFFPRDGEDEEWSAIKAHSVALLRYPMTIPLRLLTTSQSPTAWSVECDRFNFPETVRSKPPVKVLRLQTAFTSDLISRFASLFARIGSPDFSEADVTKIQRDLLA